MKMGRTPQNTQIILDCNPETSKTKHTRSGSLDIYKKNTIYPFYEAAPKCQQLLCPVSYSCGVHIMDFTKVMS